MTRFRVLAGPLLQGAAMKIYEIFTLFPFLLTPSFHVLRYAYVVATQERRVAAHQPERSGKDQINVAGHVVGRFRLFRGARRLHLGV
jgi:hypothetical protein